MKDHQLMTGDDIRPLNVVDLREYDEEFQRKQYSTVLEYTNTKVWIYEHSIRVEIRKIESVELYIFNRTIL